MIKQKFLAFILMYSVGLLFLPAFAGPLHAAGDDDDSDSSMRLQEKETIRKTLISPPRTKFWRSTTSLARLR